MSREADKNTDRHDDSGGDFRHGSDFDLVALGAFGAGEVSVASIFESSSSGYPEMDLTRWSGVGSLRDEISDRRCFELGLSPVSTSTRFLAVIPPFSERTRLLPLPESVTRMDDESLRRWLVDAESNGLEGTDGHPLFDVPSGENCVSVSRLPDGNVAVTEVPRTQRDELIDSISRTLGVGRDCISIALETSSRACLRYFLLATNEGAALEKRTDAAGTAIIILTRSGFNVSFWSPVRGLFAENGYPAPAGFSDESGEMHEVSAELDSYFRQAIDELFIQIETMEHADEPFHVSRVVWCAESEIEGAVSAVMGEFTSQYDVDFIALDRSAEEASACGLLLVSKSIVSADDAELLPQTDLARGLDSEPIVEDSLGFEEDRPVHVEAVDTQRRNLAFAILGPPVAILAVIIAMIAHSMWTSSSLDERLDVAVSKESELKPALQRRREFEKSIAHYREVVLAVSSLRERQPLTMSLLEFLDDRFPADADSGFFVSELKLGDDGSMRGKGLARNKDVVIEFLRSLEQGRDSAGLPIFEGLTYTVREAELGASNVYVATDLSRPRTQYRNLAPGVVEWELAADFASVKRNLAKVQAKNGAASDANGGGASQ